MEKLSSDQIDEIAENIGMGMLCFYHVPADEIISLPAETTEINADYTAIYSAEEIANRKRLDEIEQHLNEYISFEKMSSRNAFDAMRAFGLSIDHDTIRDNLLKSLDRPHPFNSFKKALQSLPQEINKRWTSFKNRKTRKWVEEQLELYQF